MQKSKNSTAARLMVTPPRDSRRAHHPEEDPPPHPINIEKRKMPLTEPTPAPADFHSAAISGAAAAAATVPPIQDLTLEDVSQMSAHDYKEYINSITLERLGIPPSDAREKTLANLKQHLIANFKPTDSPLPDFLKEVALISWIKVRISPEAAQHFFLAERSKIVSKAEILLREKSEPKDILEFLAQERKRIAMILGHYPPREFGKRREGLREEKRISPLCGLQGAERKYVERALSIPELVKKDDQEEFFYAPEATLNGESVTLTSLSALYKHIPRFELERAYGINPDNYPSACIIHTTIRDSKKFEEHAIQLTKAFLENNESSKEEMTRDLMTIGFWMIHALPYARGNGTITEMLLMALAQSKGMQLTFEKRFDLEVYISCMTAEDFSSQKGIISLS